MKNIISVLLLILIIGCASENTPQVTVDDRPQQEVQAPAQPQEQPPALPNVPSEDIEETDSIKETREEMSGQAKEVLGLAEKRVKSLKYTYYGQETLPSSYNYWVKGSKIKIGFPSGSEYKIGNQYYKYVYIDSKAKTATVACDDESGSCDSEPQDIDFNTYGNIKTPLEYLDEITSFDIVSTENLGSREVFRAESNIGMVWIDSYYGVPLKIEKDGKTIIRIEGFVPNQVKDSDVIFG